MVFVVFTGYTGVAEQYGLPHLPALCVFNCFQVWHSKRAIIFNASFEKFFNDEYGSTSPLNVVALQFHHIVKQLWNFVENLQSGSGNVWREANLVAVHKDV